MADIDTVMDEVERQDRSKRRQKLFEIIRLILDGKVDSSKTPIAKIFNSSGPRKPYVSPLDRGGYNYGYMTVEDMDR